MSNTLWIIISWMGQILLLLIIAIVLLILIVGLALGLWKAVAALFHRKS